MPFFRMSDTTFEKFKNIHALTVVENNLALVQEQD